jgi:hypothetical protein
MTTSLEGVEGSASRPGRSLPQGKTRYPLYRRLGGPQGRSAQVRKILSPTGIRSPDLPVRSQSLYRLGYPARARHIKVIVRRKVSRVHAREVYKVSGGTDPLFLKIDTKCTENGQPHAPKQFCLRQTSPWYPLAGVHSRFGRIAEELYLLPLPRFEHRIIQTLGYSLQRLHYPGFFQCVIYSLPTGILRLP